jgi:hypothetical protein
MLTDWPGGAQTQVAKCRPSDIELWLNRYDFGPASRNLHLACAKEVFARSASILLPHHLLLARNRQSL